MDKKYKVLGIFGIIAQRKSYVYHDLLDRLPKSTTSSSDCREKLKEVIARIPYEHFLSKEEKRSKRILINTQVKDLPLEQIYNHILYGL